ncbi:hypothetical protein [Actinacidiphila rubida]|uniref:hypothetical protein n=1 Tax=Actinacidiphila rubida TaxID=310780 RepID=UPI00114D24CE|nr:hypothetical protein [Actinacidiphila rubida]
MDTRTRHSEADAFFRDIALCVATYRAGGPAMVWPAGSGAVVDPYGERAPDGDAGAGRAGDDSAVLRPADPRMREMADRLGTFVGRPVRAGYWALGQGGSTAPCELEHDTVLVQLAGSCECRVAGPGPAADDVDVPAADSPAADDVGVPAADGPSAGDADPAGVRVRLRAGEALYMARPGSYALTGVHASCTLVELRLQD